MKIMLALNGANALRLSQENGPTGQNMAVHGPLSFVRVYLEAPPELLTPECRAKYSQYFSIYTDLGLNSPRSCYKTQHSFRVADEVVDQMSDITPFQLMEALARVTTAELARVIKTCPECSRRRSSLWRRLLTWWWTGCGRP